MNRESDLFENGVYIYQGIELTAAIMAKMLKVFYSGKQFKRQEALKTIVDFHRDNGGLLEKKTYISTIKTALSKTLGDECINKSYGVWYLRPSDENENDVQSIVENNEGIIENEIIENESIQDEIQLSEKIIGDGDKAVYVYYYETYKQYALLQGKKAWECKVGRTDVDPIQRVLGQASTCYPESPHIALIIRCDNSNIIETTLHNILKLKGRWIENAPGKEWFITSPEEIEVIYRSIVED